ncbi:Holliday junction resolvase RuvX [Pontibacter sp. G13]|uniref:Holliday junction resolvase RuvX n=1 Tax=Pontibacter sp. G13 TaxID=3074898 RepID=UPI00288B7962|nr:Holliday junction resolvase RuvX [Pontibacter sp. G13]WNJ20887.1 Holliday junction resolvase RuvX [Pontibacter sp. G13]
MARILSIDYGLKRTGLAWTDPLQIIATGVGCFPTNEVKAKIQELAAQEDIETIVLGWPTRHDGSDTHSTPAVRKFSHWLNKRFSDKQIVLWDERYTSKLALDAMIQAGVKKKRRSDKQLINEVSATILLQDYLEGNP